MAERDLYDITFVGGGPVGLFGAYYAGLRDARTKIIEMTDRLGGRLIHLYPEKMIFDVMGYPKITARELVEKLVEQASQYEPTVCLGEKVEHIKVLGECLVRIQTNRGEHFSKTVIITAGLGAFVPRTLDL
ncbi:MAG: NAD(P)/FAD-dependent oxidoreductase, partial [Deltaproteobacteria bacterium]